MEPATEFSHAFLDSDPTLLSSFSSTIHTMPYCPSIFLTNARSIFPKLDELRLSVSAFDAHVII